jgi:Peptidase family M3
MRLPRADNRQRSDGVIIFTLVVRHSCRRNWRTAWLVVLIAGALTVVTAYSEAVEERLTRREQQLETSWAEYWRQDYRAAQGDKEASSRAARAAIRSVLHDTSLIRALRSTRFADPILERRRFLFLDAALWSKIADDARLGKIEEGISQRDAKVRFRAGGRSLTRAELANLLHSEPDRHLRRTAWEAQAQFSPVNGEPIRRAMRLRNELSGRYSGQPFADTALAHRNLDRSQLLRWFEEIRAATDAPYRRLLARMRDELRVTSVEPWDIDFYFSVLSKPIEGSLFQPANAWPSIVRISDDLGIGAGRLPIDIKAADIAFGGATYPVLYGQEIKILVNKHSGIRFTDTLLHEFGHALHYALIDEPSFLLKSGYSEAFDEGVGQVMALLLYRPHISTTYFGLNSAQARALREQYQLKSLLDLRENIAESLFELAAYDNPDQDLAALYNQIQQQYTGVNFHGQAVWTFNPFFGSEPLYLQNYVLAEMFGRQVHQAMDGRFGAQWGKSGGEFLKRSLFSVGARYPLDQVLVNVTGEPLTAKYLIQSLSADPAEGARK